MMPRRKKKRGGFVPIGDRPNGRRVLRRLVLPDGRIFVGAVWVAYPANDGFADNKVRPGHVDEHGRVPRRGSGA